MSMFVNFRGIWEVSKLLLFCFFFSVFLYSIWSLAFIIKDYDKIFVANMATGLQSFAFKRPVTSLFCDLEKPNKKRSLLFLFKILNLKLQKTTWGIFKKLLAWVFALLLKVKILKPNKCIFSFLYAGSSGARMITRNHGLSQRLGKSASTRK